MKIRKDDSKSKNDEKSLRKREEMPWGLDPFRDFDRFFSDFSRDFFDEFRERYWTPRFAPWWGHGSIMAHKTPLADLLDNGKEFVISVEMPGVSKEDIDITIHADSVEIEAKREADTEEKGEGYYYRERGTSSYYRRIPLPEEVDTDKAEGKMVNGVLELILPKLNPSDVKAKKIKLQ